MKASIVVTFEDGTSFSCTLGSVSLELQRNIEEPAPKNINMVSPWELPPSPLKKEVTLKGVVDVGSDRWADPPTRLCQDV